MCPGLKDWLISPLRRRCLEHMICLTGQVLTDVDAAARILECLHVLICHAVDLPPQVARGLDWPFAFEAGLRLAQCRRYCL